MVSKRRMAKESLKHILQNYVLGPNAHFPEELDWHVDNWVDELIDAAKEAIEEGSNK